MASTRSSRSGQSPAFDLFLVLLMVVALLLVIVAAVRPTEAGGSDAGEPPDMEVTAHLSLREFAIEGDLVIPPGDVTLEVSNDGTAVHNLVIEGAQTPDLNPGEATSLAVGALGVGEYRMLCNIPGHASSGMEATLTVSAGAEDPGSGGHHGEDPDWEALDAAMMESILRFPAETAGRGNQPLTPEILADGTKQFELTVAITPWEVEPGRIVDAWTYNGQVPGPAIRVEVGDRVRVIVNNELPMGTDVHWHGIKTPNDQDGVAPITQPLIESGSQFTYEFTAASPAIGMYHAHHHGQMQIPNGLFGTFTIGETPIPYGATVSGVTIPESFDIALEIPMVLNDAGVIGFSLNGKSFPATDPYVLASGDWMVVHYYNEGLQAHPMHQHQFPQLVFAKDGIPLDHPYWADTVNVAPGERYSVLMHATDPGVWVWHCHILNHVERAEGMFGMVTALIVE